MKKHVVWRPHVEAESLLNPFVPPERNLKTKGIDIDEAHREEIALGDDESSDEACCCGTARQSP